MDADILEDASCVVSYTDSQKSLATTNAYSQDMTDSSSGKESRCTYVLEVDSDRSDGSRAAPPPPPRPAAPEPRPAAPEPPPAAPEPAASSRGESPRRAPVTDATGDQRPTELSEVSAQCELYHETSMTTNLPTYSLVSQETFTQTSKTIFELAQVNNIKCINVDTNAIQTQTSHVSIVENKTVEYRIQVSGSHTRFTRHEVRCGAERALDGWRRRARSGACGGGGGSRDSDGDVDCCDTLRISDNDLRAQSGEQLYPSDEYTSENPDTSKYDTDLNDSLDEDYPSKRGGRDDVSETSVPKSVDKDVEELYDKLEKSFDLRSVERPEEFDIPRYTTLTPLTEETTAKVDSFLDNIKTESKEMSIKINTKRPDELSYKELQPENEQWKLPPIRRSPSPSPSSPRRRRGADRWETGARHLAAGEGAGAAARAGSAWSHLPSIHTAAPAPAPRQASRGDCSAGVGVAPRDLCHPRGGPRDACPPPDSRETISIHNKIQQLKLPGAGKNHALYSSTTTGSRSSSPDSRSCARAGAGASAGAAAARSGEALCADVLARLRRQDSGCARMTFEQPAGAARYECGDGGGCNWAETVEVLEDIPVMFRNFWGALSEHRVADLLRLVTAQVESPRTRVACAACATLATILKHTNYTKKPEFSEAVAALLVKTGSCVRPLRRAANVALDGVVAGVELSHSVTVLCLFGVEHKSPAVRSAAARLLVVAAALARGGRGLLRARPPSAAHARRLALRALSALLHDRNQDTRCAPPDPRPRSSHLRPPSAAHARRLALRALSALLHDRNQDTRCAPPDPRPRSSHLRPPSAAHARRLALRALSALLHDRNQDTRCAPPDPRPRSSHLRPPSAAHARRLALRALSALLHDRNQDTRCAPPDPRPRSSHLRPPSAAHARRLALRALSALLHDRNQDTRCAPPDPRPRSSHLRPPSAAHARRLALRALSALLHDRNQDTRCAPPDPRPRSSHLRPPSAAHARRLALRALSALLHDRNQDTRCAPPDPRPRSSHLRPPSAAHARRLALRALSALLHDRNRDTRYAPPDPRPRSSHHRPPSAAHARRLALRALSALLHDRNQDTRKYAERLYAMLRPLPGFEAFFLADVDARTAYRQMGKYDQLLAPPAPAPAPR